MIYLYAFIDTGTNYLLTFNYVILRWKTVWNLLNVVIERNKMIFITSWSRKDSQRQKISKEDNRFQKKAHRLSPERPGWKAGDGLLGSELLLIPLCCPLEAQLQASNCTSFRDFSIFSQEVDRDQRGLELCLRPENNN